MKLLTREDLTEAQWTTLRNAPQLVLRAVSGAGGTRLDALLEHTAGTLAIAGGRNNDHPLIREFAIPAEIEAATRATEAAIRNAKGALRSPNELIQLAVDGVSAAAAVLRSVGGELDRYAYHQFIMTVARSVAEAAREGDFLGLGGQLVSDAERTVIAEVSRALAP